MTEPQTLVISSDLENLPAVLAFVREACLSAGLDADQAFACELATDEACTNIIEHAYQGRGNGRIEISCQHTPDRFIVRLHDHGAPFNPSQVRGPLLEDDLARRDVGGLGLHFMRSLMDEVDFEFDPQGGNTLTMFKALPGRSK